jgi:hypothetical protein
MLKKTEMESKGDEKKSNICHYCKKDGKYIYDGTSKDKW